MGMEGRRDGGGSGGGVEVTCRPQVCPQRYPTWCSNDNECVVRGEEEEAAEGAGGGGESSDKECAGSVSRAGVCAAPDFGFGFCSGVQGLGWRAYAWESLSANQFSINLVLSRCPEV